MATVPAYVDLADEVEGVPMVLYSSHTHTHPTYTHLCYLSWRVEAAPQQLATAQNSAG